MSCTPSSSCLLHKQQKHHQINVANSLRDKRRRFRITWWIYIQVIIPCILKTGAVVSFETPVQYYLKYYISLYPRSHNRIQNTGFCQKKGNNSERTRSYSILYVWGGPAPRGLRGGLISALHSLLLERSVAHGVSLLHHLTFYYDWCSREWFIPKLFRSSIWKM